MGQAHRVCMKIVRREQTQCFCWRGGGIGPLEVRDGEQVVQLVGVGLAYADGRGGDANRRAQQGAQLRDGEGFGEGHLRR